MKNHEIHVQLFQGTTLLRELGSCPSLKGMPQRDHNSKILNELFPKYRR